MKALIKLFLKKIDTFLKEMGKEARNVEISIVYEGKKYEISQLVIHHCTKGGWRKVIGQIR